MDLFQDDVKDLCLRIWKEAASLSELTLIYQCPWSAQGRFMPVCLGVGLGLNSRTSVLHEKGPGLIPKIIIRKLETVPEVPKSVCWKAVLTLID